MNDYSNWKERHVAVTSLQLDAKNPRLPDLGRELTQREIIAELVEHEDVYELARGIADQGYFPTEVVIAVNEDDQLVVVEGNRRLTALKLLLSPGSAPETEVKRFRLLQNRVIPDAISKIRVSVAPSRDVAAPLVLSRHKGNVTRGWKPTEQAKYFRTLSLMDGGKMSIDEVAAFLGVSRGELTDNLKLDTMYQIARVLALPDDVREVVLDPRQFNASVFERIVQSKPATDYFALKFDDRGRLRGDLHEDEFRKSFGRVVTDIVQKPEMDTRRLNKAEDIDRYLKGLGKDAPNRKRKGTFTSETLLGTAPPPVSLRKAAEAKKPPVRKESPYLVPAGFKCPAPNMRIRSVYGELRRLKVEDYTNSCAVLLRILLELAAGRYLDESKKIQPLLDKAKNEGKKSHYYPTLRQMLRTLLDDKDITLVPLNRKALNAMVNNEQHPLSLDEMDGFVHNRFTPPSERDLRKFWLQLEALLAQLLVDPVPVAPPAPAVPGAAAAPKPPYDAKPAPK